MQDRLLTFVGEMQSAATFEAAADLALRRILAVCEAALRESPFVGQARLLRGAVHIRPSGAYSRIAAHELGGQSAEATPYVHSASAWRWVQKQRRPIAIDVHLGVVQVQEGAGFTVTHEETSRPFEGNESRNRLLGRDATHLFVLPLRAPGGEIAGMISVEADARIAMGTAFLWPDVTPIVQAMVDVAAPPLLSLPATQAGGPVDDPLLPVVGASMRSVVETLRVFAQQSETILLSGPVGAGKSRLARWSHEVSARRAKPFETVDLRTVPESLQMAQLFGWKKGAFTNAMKDTVGYVRRAEGGTLFMDEIDKLSLEAQAGLLRVLEERRYRPIGDDGNDRTADVRFIVGTNAPLLQHVRQGTFLLDLYYRIHVLPVRVPPLAERKDEIPSWAAFMLRRRHGETGHKGEAGLSPQAEQLLVAQPWEGNLRQLDNIVRRAYALFLVSEGPSPARIVLDASHVERALLYEAVTETGSCVSLLQAAAAAFVAEAEKRKGAPLDLDLADAFRGFVLAVAAQKLESVEEAFRLFGKGSLVQHRNHLKTLRKELARVERVYEELEGGPSPFRSLGQGEE